MNYVMLLCDAMERMAEVDRICEDSSLLKAVQGH